MSISNSHIVVRFCVAASLVALSGALVGCNAVEGAAKDLHETGENLGEGADRAGRALTGQDGSEEIPADNPETID